MDYRVPRGTQDILPPASAAWQRAEGVARELLERFGYSEIRTPIFEMKELFLRTVGEETDIVQKEMYAFEDRKGRQFALRPEGTAPVIRSYVENSLWKENPLLKLYYMGPMFRYDRPQKGRYRQFHQIGAEAVGSLNPAVDAEVIAMVEMILQAVGIKRVTVKLNSLGEAESRRAIPLRYRNISARCAGSFVAIATSVWSVTRCECWTARYPAAASWRWTFRLSRIILAPKAGSITNRYRPG